MLENPLIEKRVAAGFSVAVVILLLVTAAAVWNVSRSAATFRWVDHTHQVLYGLEKTMTEVLKVQSGGRGYLLTEERIHLEVYEQGLAAAKESIQELRQLTADNPLQQERLNRFEEELQTFEGISQRRQHAQLSRPALAASLQEGQAALDRLTSLIRTMETEERTLLTERSSASQQASRTMVTTMTLGGVLAASFILVAAIRVRRDVHHRRSAERELQDFFRLSVDPMVVLGSNGCILRLNPAWTAILGHAAETLRGKSFLELVHPDDIEPTRDHMAKLGHASASVSFEARYRTSRDEWRWFQWNAIPAKSGAVIYGAARDITDYKAALAALKKSADEIRDLYNLAPCGYHSLGADGRFLAINDTELSWLGYTRAEVVGKLRFPALLISSSHLSFDESFQRFKALGWVNDLEFELVRKDGTTFPVSLSATAIRDADGTFIASRSTLFDITERKHVEHRIRRLNMDLQLQNAQLEIANKELESFSYSISHDLRAPLRHIDGFAGLLAQHASHTLDDKGRRFISVISESAKRMGRLIDDLLTFSRMGRTVMNEIEIDHDQLVGAVIRDGRFEATPAIQWHVSPLPRVRADAAMLRQVWVNLIDNAVKYSAQSTPPRIEIGAFTDSADATELVFFVKDNGVGFDMKYAAKLFGVFQRLHTDAEFEGTGIGLANVRRIVTRHGGRSWAESSVGAGSTFYFSLPAAIHPPLPTSL